MGKILFQKQIKVEKEKTRIVPKDVIEKQFIMSFLQELPIEGLKKLISFKEIDFENKKPFEELENPYTLDQLRHENVVMYKCKLELEEEINGEKKVVQ